MAQGVLIDIGGVLTAGRTAAPGAVAALARLRRTGLPMRLITNTTRRPKATLVADLNDLGFDVAPEEIFAPAQAGVDLLCAQGLRPHLLVHPDLKPDFAACPASGDCAVVVGDAGPYFTFERLNAAYRELIGGARFYALAANRAFRDADGQMSLDAGAFVQALSFASGVEPVILGKPAPAFYGAAVAALGCSADETVMIGDDAEVDVAGALSAGIGTAILVRTGKYREGDDDRFSPRPSATVADFAAAVDAVLA